MVVRRGRTTHVLLPLEEYEALLAEKEYNELTAMLDDPNTKWIPLEVAAKEFVVDRIVEARKYAGLTQAQLAAKLKMPQSQISRIEKNPDRTTVRTLKKIAAALGVNVKALLP